jgi:UrcA family protein
MNTNLRNKVMAAMCLGYGMAGVSAAGAADGAPPSEVVRFADLNISDPAGAQTLYRRIQAAARRVCQVDAVWNNPTLGREQACYRHAVDEAVKGVHSAALSQIHGNGVPHLASAAVDAQRPAGAVVDAKRPASADDVRMAKVSVADLDLGTAGGMKAAQARVREVARHLCTQLEQMDDLSRHANYLACVDSSVTAAMQQLKAPALAALAKQKLDTTP